MMNQEQKQKNIDRHKESGTIDIFEENEDYPSKIIFNSPKYGKYILKPFFYINLNDEKPGEVSDALAIINDISPTKSSWNLNVINLPNADNYEMPIEFIWYLVDYDDNIDYWYDENKDGEYIKENPDCKTLPIVSKEDYKNIQEVWEKYPMTKLKNYPY